MYAATRHRICQRQDESHHEPAGSHIAGDRFSGLPAGDLAITATDFLHTGGVGSRPGNPPHCRLVGGNVSLGFLIERGAAAGKQHADHSCAAGYSSGGKAINPDCCIFRHRVGLRKCGRVIQNGIVFAYDLANYVVPLLLLPYLAIKPMKAKELDRLLYSYANIAVLVAIYGIIQYLTVPPWDAFWMNHVEMNSIGVPEPLQIRVFSSMNSPGPCAIFLAMALVPMLMEKRWRGTLGWIGVLLTVVCLLVTLVRSAWLIAFVMLLAYILSSSSKGKWKTLFQLAIVGLLLYIIVPKLPGAEGLVARMQTLTDIQQDHSYNERLDLLHTMLPAITNNPVGQGIGSVGIGTKLDNGGDLGELGIMDNGYIAIFLTFGICGAFFFFGGLFVIIKRLLVRIAERNSSQPYIRLALATWAGAVASLISDNGFPGMRGYLIWMMIGIGLWAKDVIAERR